MVIIDRADWQAHALAYEAFDLPLGWRIRVTEGVTQGDKIREVWDEIKDCAWLGLIGDDNIPETAGWDARLVERLDGWNLVSCNDAWLAPRRVGNCWVMSGPLVRLVGAVFPAGLHHLFVDDAWEHLGREARCWECLMDVTVRHAHVMKGEAEADATHKAVYGEGFTQPHAGPDLAKGLWAGDGTAYQGWLRDDAPRLAAQIRAARAEAAPPPDPVIAHRQTRALGRSVMICTPIRRAPTVEYTASFGSTLLFLASLGVRATFHFVVGSSVIHKARNELCAHFLASDYTDLLFVDDDMEFSPHAVLRLLGSDKPLIGGVGRMRCPKPNSDPAVWCWRPLRAEGGPGAGELTQDEMGAVEVRGFGGAFMLVNRRVFADMVEAHPEWKRDGAPDWPERLRQHYFEFFTQSERDEFGELSEDYAFCHRWRQLGGRVFVDATIGLGHVGSFNYRGKLEDLLVAAEPRPTQERAA